MSKKVIINVPMVSRSSVCLPGDTQDAHKGIWFYDPTAVVPPGMLEIGDIIEFRSCSGMEIVAIGRVTDLASLEDTQKFCSRVNDHGVRWEEVFDDNPST